MKSPTINSTYATTTTINTINNCQSYIFQLDYHRANVYSMSCRPPIIEPVGNDRIHQQYLTTIIHSILTASSSITPHCIQLLTPASLAAPVPPDYPTAQPSRKEPPPSQHTGYTKPKRCALTPPHRATAVQNGRSLIQHALCTNHHKSKSNSSQKRAAVTISSSTPGNPGR